MKPFVQPKITGVKRGGKNRFNVSLDMGSITSCVDAQALTEVAVDELVAQIKANWASGRKADGSTQPARKQESSLGPGYPAFDEKKKVEIENEILDKEFKLKKPKPGANTPKGQATYKKKLATYEKRKKTFATIKKNYSWKKIYHPVFGLPSLNRSGMLVDTLRRDTVYIKERNGRIPRKVSTRIVVSPKRGEAVARMRLVQMQENSPAFVAATKTMGEGMKQTTSFKSYKEASDKESDVIRRFMVWAWRKKIVQKILAKVARAITS